MNEILVDIFSYMGVFSYFIVSDWILIGVILGGILAYFGAPFVVWYLGGCVGLFLAGVLSASVWWTALGIGVVFLFSFFRQRLISLPLLKLLSYLKLFPRISQTEREAIDAGTVWIDRDLFSGSPDFKKILNETYPRLSRKEKQFLEGPVTTVCEMVDDWSVYKNRDFPKKVWQFLKKEKFFGMGIPKKYGGLEFSAFAHSCVIAKLASRSISLAITVMVPNSLGPGELLTHFGTAKQKSYYLPRLATGEEIPCFALTEPLAGSDAGSIQSSGVLFKGKDGELYIRMNWCKRWITLAAISTVIGIAFKLRDPDNLLGQGEDLGITCALVPSDTKGVVLGQRHDPLSVPFYNCPTEGHNVVVSVDTIIGGVKQAGQGWRMLMECLSAGRGISLPANSVGGGWLSTRVVGAFSVIRQQFGSSIGQFEGVQEALARIGGYTYLLDAMRSFTCGALDSGAKPAVVTAIAKYNATELFRVIINDSMDVMGGAAITMGKRNVLAKPYIAAPIGITVEGANILTRTLMIFGQGAIRCHPYVLDQIQSVEQGDFKRFDQAFFAHIGHFFKNFVRTLVLTVTRGFVSLVPHLFTFSRSYQRLSWASAMFALFSDLALVTLGASLKRKEAITGRFADILSWMYMATCVLRRFESDKRPSSDRDIVSWVLETAFYRMQCSFEELTRELWVLRPFLYLLRLFPLGAKPSDALMRSVALGIQVPSDHRDRLTQGLYVSSSDETVGRFDEALKSLVSVQPILKRLKQAMRKKVITKGPVLEVLSEAVSQKVISEKERVCIEQAEALRLECIHVDAFKLADYLAHKP